MENYGKVENFSPRTIGSQLANTMRKSEMEDFNLYETAENTVKSLTLNNFTVLVAGKTGVGKSTLLNSVFRGNVASTGCGKPQTKLIKKYQKKGIPISIIDTVGIEVKDYKSILDELSEYIDEKMDSDDPEEHITLAWLCIARSSDRIEEAEKDLYKFIREKGIPCIIVITKVINRKDKSFSEAIKNEINDDCKIVQVRALDEELENGQILEAIGIDELMEETYKIVPDSLKRSYSNALSNKHRKALDIKKRQAILEVNIAAGAAGAAGATPIPFSQAFVIVPIQVAMLAKISQTFGMEVDASILTTLVSSLIGASAATIVGRTVVSGLLKLIPGIGSVAGGAIAATTAAALTKSIGNTYINVVYDFIKDHPSEKIDIEFISSELKSKFSFNS